MNAKQLYELIERGFDTWASNEGLFYLEDSRGYSIAKQSYIAGAQLIVARLKVGAGDTAGFPNDENMPNL